MNSLESLGEAYSAVPRISSVPPLTPVITSNEAPSASAPPGIEGWLQTFSEWSHPDRLVAINELIGHCNAHEIQDMMKIIEPQLQLDFISLLPEEIAMRTLSYLDPRDLLQATQVCKNWQKLAEDNLLWREKCRKAGIEDLRAILSNGATTARESGQSSTDGVSNVEWKAEFKRNHIIEVNWKRKDTQNPSVLRGHEDYVITCLLFSEDRIISGSDDNTLKVWSATTGKCLHTLVGHSGGVWASQMSGTTLVSASTDRTLRVWNIETGQCIHTLFGHLSTVRCLKLYGNKVVSGSRDSTLRMWDIEKGECEFGLMGHAGAVRCVQYNGQLIVSGSYDYTVRIWDPKIQECLHVLSGHSNRVYSLQFDGTRIISGSLDTTIKVWEAATGACIHTFTGHTSLTSVLSIRDNLLVSGNADSTAKIWDLSIGECLFTLNGPNKHCGAITCVQLVKIFVVTASDDGTVKLWDLRTGEFIRNLVSLSSRGSGGVVWRCRASETKLVIAVGSRNGTEETKLLVFDFD